MFSTRQAKALNVKERVRQTGVVVTLSRDNGNCYAEATSTKTEETSSRRDLWIEFYWF